MKAAQYGKFHPLAQDMVEFTRRNDPGGRRGNDQHNEQQDIGIDGTGLSVALGCRCITRRVCGDIVLHYCPSQSKLIKHCYQPQLLTFRVAFPIGRRRRAGQSSLSPC
ncbi:hypothetical protein NVIRENTERO_02162 [Sodalis praecaptivus]|nr:hypothetical protein NVIRENTERO_02162 [Sodalis praecaptivus]